MLFPKWGALTAFDALSETYKAILRIGEATSLDMKGLTEEFQVDGGLKVPISDDSDSHRKRVGYLLYPTLEFCRFGNKIWLLGCASSEGPYAVSSRFKELTAIEWPYGISQVAELQADDLLLESFLAKFLLEFEIQPKILLQVYEYDGFVYKSYHLGLTARRLHSQSVLPGRRGRSERLRRDFPENLALIIATHLQNT